MKANLSPICCRVCRFGFANQYPSQAEKKVLRTLIQELFDERESDGKLDRNAMIVFFRVVIAYEANYIFSAYKLIFDLCNCLRRDEGPFPVKEIAMLDDAEPLNLSYEKVKEMVNRLK